MTSVATTKNPEPDHWLRSSLLWAFVRRVPQRAAATRVVEVIANMHVQTVDHMFVVSIAELPSVMASAVPTAPDREQSDPCHTVLNVSLNPVQ